ncbi:MAG: type 4a pilus biogenesis protein PilO [Nitrospirae bacterium]|nr:type 4a pilus biogenesis protein PilO [Nitrospirota bacterium]
MAAKVDLRVQFFRLPGPARYGLAASVSVIAFAIFYFSVFMGQQGKIRNLQAVLAQKQQANLMNRHVEQELPRLKQVVKDLEAQINAGLAELPNEKEVPQLIKDLENLALKLRMKVFYMKLQNEVAKGFYAEVPVEVKIRGAYHNTAIFFDEISRFARIISMTNIQIGQVTKDKEGSPLVTTSCQATTFRYLPSTLPQAPGTPSGAGGGDPTPSAGKHDSGSQEL